MKVENWDKWQTFRKDRGTPPWIKVYRNLLSNEQWVELSDSEKGQLISIWILAADKNGHIPDNPKMIQRMAMLDSKPNLNKFIELEFLSTTCQPPDNQEKKLCPQSDTPEKSRDRVETEVKRLDQSEIDQCFDMFWSSGIRKVNKKKSKPLFAKHLNENHCADGPTIYDLVNALVKDIQKRITSNQLGFSEMHPTTYLNGERWNDEITGVTNETHQQNNARFETTSDRYERQARELRKSEAGGNDEDTRTIQING